VAKYGINYYGASTYGAAALLSYSVQPMSILVYSEITSLAAEFRRVRITWENPTGSFTRFRLVRSQVGFPETAEDGVIIFDEFATEGTVSRSYFVDGEDNPGDITLVPGRETYYRVFLFTSEKIWVNAGSIAAIIPSDHNAHANLMNSIPRVFTSKEQSPLGVVDDQSTLYDFLWGMSFTQEEFYTLIDLIRPRHSGLETPVQLIFPERSNVGLTAEPGLPVKNQKRLIREALYMYTHKGTADGIGTYAESLTGFAPTITVSDNLLLTVQDSTFYGTIGNWTTNNATLSSSNEQVPSLTDNVIDSVYTCKVIASASGYMSLGESDPIHEGVPVLPDTEYTFSCKLKSPSSSGNITLTVTFFDRDGQETTSDTATAVSANNTWKTASLTLTTDADASYAVIDLAYSAAGTYYIDQVCAQIGDTVVYDEARSVDLFLSPTKTNYIKNPSFEVNVTDSWTKTGLATVTQDTDVSDAAYSGVKSAKIVGTGAWTYGVSDIPVTSGNYYTFSAFVKTTAGFSVTFIGKDALGDPTGHSETTAFNSSADWVRISVTDLIDAVNEVDVAYYDIELSGTSGTLYLDCVQFEKGNKASDYFDGSLPSSFGAVWEGTEDDSYTHLYPNKPTKVPRLGKTLADWVPMNTFWRLRSYDGLEYTNLTV
jgi:hypothetical protein